MKSLIIMLVDNGETTDEIEDAVRAASNAVEVIDWTTRVDISKYGVDYTFRVDPSDAYVYGIRSKDKVLY